MAISIAVIGANHWHTLYDAAYLRRLIEMPDVRITGIQDDDIAIAQQRADAIGGGIPTFASYESMLSETRPQFVLALGRHDRMAATATWLMEHGIPFIMEKPMSLNTRELRGIVEKAEALNAFAAVPLGYRFAPLMRHARKLIDDGTLGPMCHMYVRMNRPTSARYPAWGTPWMLDPKIAGGGCLRNLGTHGLDCFVYLTGEGESIEVTGAQLSWSTHGKAVEDYASVLLKSRNGVLGTVEVGNGYPSMDGGDGELKVAFRDGILKSEGTGFKLHTAAGVESFPAAPNPGSVLASILRQTIEAIARGDKPPVNVRDCYLTVRLIDLAYIAAGNPYGNAAV
jgi:predicted dehydrogenase